MQKISKIALLGSMFVKPASSTETVIGKEVLLRGLWVTLSSFEK